MSGEHPERLMSEPPHPEALIEVDPSTESVTLNGQPVAAPEGTDLYVAGIRAATEMARGLSRPVWALAKDPNGQTALVVNPDGSVTDLEELPVPPLAPNTAAAGQMSQPHTAGLSDPPPEPETTAAPEVDATTQAPRKRSRAVVLVGAGLSLAVVATVGVALMLGAGDDEREPVSESMVEQRAAEPFEVTAGVALEPKPVVRVIARGGVERLQLKVSSSELPLRARLVLVRLGDQRAKPIQRMARLTKRGQEWTFRDLAPGTYRWQAKVTGADPVSGRVRVQAPAPVTPSPAPPAPPVPSVPEPAYPSTPSYPSTPAPPPPSSGGGGGGGRGPDRPVDPGGPEPTAPVPN